MTHGYVSRSPFSLLAAAGDFADDLRSLGLYEATSTREALVRCLARLDEDPAADHEAALRDPEVAELLRRERTPRCPFTWACGRCTQDRSLARSLSWPKHLARL